MTNSAALKASIAMAYRFQSIRAGSRRPSRRQRNIGRASRPRPARSAGHVERAEHRPAEREGQRDRQAERPERMQPGQVRFHGDDLRSWVAGFRSVRAGSWRTRGRQGGHGQHGGQVEHGGSSGVGVRAGRTPRPGRRTGRRAPSRGRACRGPSSAILRSGCRLVERRPAGTIDSGVSVRAGRAAISRGEVGTAPTEKVNGNPPCASGRGVMVACTRAWPARSAVGLQGGLVLAIRGVVLVADSCRTPIRLCTSAESPSRPIARLR